MDRPVRILLVEPTLDGHDSGARHLARVLRDSGFEVVFMSFLRSDDVVVAAVQEDVDVVVISSSGGQLPVVEDVLTGLQERGLDDVLLIGSGIFRAEDADKVNRAGVGRIFGPGSDPQEITTYIRERNRFCTGIHG